MLKTLLYTLLTSSVLLLSACGAPESPTVEEAASEAVAAPSTSTAESVQTATDADRPAVLIFGDSIAAGLGVDPDQSFPAVLQARLDSAGVEARIINAGLSGETSAAGLRRIDWVLQQPADVLVLELGGNDGLRGIDLASTRANLQGIIDKARTANPEIVVVVAGMMIPPNLGQDYTSAFASLFPDLAEANDAILIPFLLDGVGGVDSLMQNDGIHPNVKGHLKVAKLTEPYVVEALNRVPD